MFPIMKPLLALIVVLLAVAAFAQPANTIAASQTLDPKDLTTLLPQKPLILNVGPRTIYAQAHIPGAEYVGMTSEPDGIKALREHVRNVPKTRFIVIYCGCCPWNRCPNVAPAYTELKSLGFKNVKVLHIAQNFGADWVSNGFPAEK